MARTVTTRATPRSLAPKTRATAKPAGKAVAPRAPKGAAPRAPQPTKEELLARLEKLERANVALRTKNRELKRAADRVAELERELERLRAAAPRRGRARNARPERDPGDAVPPGVAVLEPEPLSEDDRKVLDRLNEELSPGQGGAETGEN